MRTLSCHSPGGESDTQDRRLGATATHSAKVSLRKSGVINILKSPAKGTLDNPTVEKQNTVTKNFLNF